jgi:phage-related protein
MVQAELAYVLKVVDETSSTMEKIRGGIGLLGSTLGQLGGGFSSVGNIMTDFAVGGPAGAAIGAFGEIAKGIQSSIEEAGKSEAVFTSLGAAVERSGASWKSVETGTKAALLSMQSLTTYSDETLAGALDRLLTFGLSYDQAMKALGASVDLAAAKHMDLESAATLVGKAVDGNTSILKRYGVDVEVAKDATDKFTPVLTALNDQFGGAAQAAANTYVGLQERLKNATQEVSEKIGTMFLPALASLTEGMLPVVDQLGKGVDAVSAWLTEVGKMPEAQGAISFLQDAFAGLGKYMQDLWGFIVDQFGPVLTELVGAFKDLWDALSPIGDALAEIRGAFGDTGDIDLFKILIASIVVQIRAVATIIKEVAPYIKAFATGFKEAVDFISPILTQMVADIRTFIDTLKTIFQDFYNWLIGRSLWTDLWSAVQRVTTEAIGQLLSAIRDTFLSTIKTVFETFTQGIETLWSNSWDAIHKSFQLTSDQIGTAWTNWTTTMQTNMTTFFTTIQTATTTSMAAIQTSFSSTMTTIQGFLTSAVATMQGAWQGFASFMSGAISSFEGAVSGASGFLTSTLSSMTSAAPSAVGTIQGMLSSAWNSITGAVSSAASSVGSAVQTVASTVTGMTSSAADQVHDTIVSMFGDNSVFESLWHNAGGIWNQLVSGAIDASTAINASLQALNQSPSATAQVLQVINPSAPPPYIPPAPTPTPTAPTPPPSQTTLNATIPVTVQVDGATVSKVVEKRIVTTASNSNKRWS